MIQMSVLAGVEEYMATVNRKLQITKDAG
jgi:hypothetical protein